MQIQRHRIAFLGTGNLASAIIRALLENSSLREEKIYIANRSTEKMEKIKAEFPMIHLCASNDEAIEKSQIVVLGMKPQDLPQALEDLRHAFSEEHILVSLAAGIDIEYIRELVPQIKQVVRVMPNTPIRIRKAVIGYSIYPEESEPLDELVYELMSPLGLAIRVEEGDELNALTVACGSGPGFIFEFMQIWQDWLVSYGYDQEIAKRMTLETFSGTSKLAEQQSQMSLVDLQNQVVSRNGVTHAGLMQMREQEISNLLFSSFERAFARNRELQSEAKKKNR